MKAVAHLSPDQLSFLREQKIPLSSMFDASGMRSKDYQIAMKADGKSFAYGVTPCGKGGHTLRTRKGHCIQCDHATIAYMLRHDARAYVYIAVSWDGRLLKIGSTTDIADRGNKLNEYRYGGQADWQIISTVRCDNAGRVESETQTKLAGFSADSSYMRAGKSQRCYELFKCNFSDAREAMRSTLKPGETILTPHEARALHVFNFR